MSFQISLIFFLGHNPSTYPFFCLPTSFFILLPLPNLFKRTIFSFSFTSSDKIPLLTTKTPNFPKFKQQSNHQRQLERLRITTKTPSEFLFSFVPCSFFIYTAYLFQKSSPQNKSQWTGIVEEGKWRSVEDLTFLYQSPSSLSRKILWNWHDNEG